MGDARIAQERALANGLRVIVKEDHRAPTVVSMVWYKAGGFRFARGWSIAGGGRAATLTTLGYVPSYLPWLCLGARWIGPRAKAGFFLALELAPLLNRTFLFW